jgi:homoserine dehydrogenase
MPLEIYIVGTGLIGTHAIFKVLKLSKLHNWKLVCFSNSSTFVALNDEIRQRLSAFEENNDAFKALIKRLLANGALKSADNHYGYGLVSGKWALVDCSASEDIHLKYITTPFDLVCVNKKLLATNDYNDFIELWNGFDNGKRLYFESTVGAGLPIIKPLRDLIASGDTIIEIQGVLSGTLSYIFNTFSKKDSPSFSAIVKTARELGYTEPDPRDDLNGTDFARKVKIVIHIRLLM